jgi:ribokinase
MDPRTFVFGPAYLDRVLLVDRPLGGDGGTPPLDQSVEGAWKFGVGLTLVDPGGPEIVVELPNGWPGPTGTVTLSRSILGPSAPPQRTVRALSWHDDLGGMGAGFAAAFGGELVSALGPEDDPTSVAVTDLLEAAGVVHHPIRVYHQPADRTLLLTSGEYGDKLPIGFRGCHACLTGLGPLVEAPCGLRVVAGLPNPLAAKALNAAGATVRMFAPAMRNMIDRDCPVSSFAGSIDMLCCNREEWERLDDREEVAWRVSLLVVTDGAAGSTVRFTNPTGEPISLRIPVFPRAHPPRDTNRAGEAYASALVRALLAGGWTPGVSDEELVARAARRGAAAGALVLDLARFGFPDEAAIDAALEAGRVG